MFRISNTLFPYINTYFVFLIPYFCIINTCFVFLIHYFRNINTCFAFLKICSNGKSDIFIPTNRKAGTKLGAHTASVT